MPVGAVVVSVPLHVVADPLVTVSPAGRVSVNATPVSGSALAAGLVMVKVREVVAFSAIVDGLNTFAMDGGASTFTLAVAVPPVPPSVDVTFPVVLFCSPGAIPVTFTVKAMQFPRAGRLAPDRLIVLLPATAVTVPPPHPETRPFGVEIIRPAGSVSLKPIPLKLVVVL